MSNPWVSPGQAADETFDTGIRVAALAGLAVLGWLYWAGFIGAFVVVFAVLALFPPYLLLVASLLSKWLGLDPDVSDLQPVTRAELREEREQ